MGLKSKLLQLSLTMLVTISPVLATFASPAAAAGADRLNLIVYGATGRVGSRVVDEALGRGHKISAVSRDPSRIEKKHENLVAVKGNVLDSASVRELIAGHDAVIVAVRGAVDKSKDPAKTVHRLAVEVIVDVMRELGPTAPRLTRSNEKKRPPSTSVSAKWAM